MNQKHAWILVVISACAGALIGAGIIGCIMLKKSSPDSLIKKYYATENAVHVSPHGLRKKMDTGDTSFILVDLRSAEEYEKDHIVGAVNIPAYSDKDTSAYGDVTRIVGEFKQLPDDKNIIVYCYSSACMTGRKIGKMLAENGIYVQHLAIGWNEWRHDWDAWNHEHEWDSTSVKDYIYAGKEPGIPKTAPSASNSCSAGSFGC